MAETTKTEFSIGAIFLPAGDRFLEQNRHLGFDIVRLVIYILNFKNEILKLAAGGELSQNRWFFREHLPGDAIATAHTATMIPGLGPRISDL